MEENSETVEKTTGNVRISTSKDQESSSQPRCLSAKLTNRWNSIQHNIGTKTKNFFISEDNVKCNHIPDKYSHIFRHKSRWEHLKLSFAVCGIEFCYAAETAFVTPILLSLGLSIQYVTIIWCLSPVVGLILTPILGSMSDSCESKYGRRRPFIILYSIGIILGLILVPNGHHIGLALGDTGHEHELVVRPSRTLVSRNVIFKAGKNYNQTSNFTGQQEMYVKEYNENLDFSENSIQLNNTILLENNTEFLVEKIPKVSPKSNSGPIQPWSIVFTVIGVVLLDFCADACQSPARTYLLDVSIPSEHASGLSTFTIMVGLGGSLGYVMGAIDWDKTVIGDLLGGHINAVFTINAIIFVICLVISLSSFTEIPLPLLKDPVMYKEYQENLYRSPKDKIGNEMKIINTKKTSTELGQNKGEYYREIEPDAYITVQNHKCADLNNEIKERCKISNGNNMNGSIIDKNGCKAQDISQGEKVEIPIEIDSKDESPKLKEYLISIFQMPKSLRILSLTNLLGWMSSVCYSLYFTDFVGESVFGGDPHAAEDSPSFQTFQEGLEFGCWGLALFCMSCGIYSLFVEGLVKKVGAKAVYIGGQLVYSVGMMITGLTKHKVAVLLLSPTAGIIYCTVFTLPYFLLADYHSNNQFSKKKKPNKNNSRGIGTDVAVISSMMFLAQFILSLTMGSVTQAVGSSAVPIFAAALLSACGALSATQVTYLNI